MKAPVNKPISQEEVGKEIRFSPLPTHALRVVGHMKALRNIKNAAGPSINKGQIYAITCVTDKGLLMVQGDIDHAYPMAAFGAPGLMRLELSTEEHDA